MKRQLFTWLATIAVACGAATAAWAHGNPKGPRVTLSFGTTWPGDGHRHSHGYGPMHHRYNPALIYGNGWRVIPPQVVVPYTYAYPPQVIVRTPPPAPVYIEQSPPVAAQAATLEPGFWYYCAASQAYYPYARECAEPWQKVAPTPGVASVR